VMVGDVLARGPKQPLIVSRAQLLPAWAIDHAAHRISPEKGRRKAAVRRRCHGGTSRRLVGEQRRSSIDAPVLA